ncbi:ABC transporter permease [Altibacter sp. HG106]|uniref:ABC transporter permease n=1 Tax=Altibacter sp. HG106 TaxID=3023937 RepID=UPI002350EA2F|nr:ABC transporter permease [Altibacter sp. HG106]MDC7994955.1 ABC transporter permease [Altibacter sp. HG106]
MRFSLYIAKRYLFSKSSSNAINIISIIAAVGVIVGAMALFIVLSAFSGLKDFSLQFSNFFDSDLKVVPASGKTLRFSEASEAKLKALPGVASYAQVVQERVFLQFKGKNAIASIKGVGASYGSVKPLDSILAVGQWFTPGDGEVVMGFGTAYKLSIGTYDYTDFLQLYVPKPGTGQITALDAANAFNTTSAVVSGVYDVNEDANNAYVFSDIETARKLLEMDAQTLSSLEIKMAPSADEEELRGQLQSIFSEEISVKNRIQQNDALYKMLNTENIAVYLIFTLVMIIALFNVIGSIIMMILDKRKNIKTLYNLGATLGEIRNIFFLQGVLMTTLGGILGILLGIGIVWGQLQFKWVYITATLPYPMQLTLPNVLVVFGTIFILGLLASKIAASRVRAPLLT